jgi:hypothetical protein
MMSRKKKYDDRPDIQPQIVVGYDGSVTITTPFRKDFIEDLKLCIPARHREFLPEEKVWVVDAEWAPQAQDVVITYFPHTTIYKED